MKQQITLREANQHLSRYIEEAQEGHEITITRRGKPVARLTGIPTEKKLSTEQEAARQRSLQRMKRGYPLGGLKVDRDDLHER